MCAARLSQSPLFQCALARQPAACLRTARSSTSQYAWGCLSASVSTGARGLVANKAFAQRGLLTIPSHFCWLQAACGEPSNAAAHDGCNGGQWAGRRFLLQWQQAMRLHCAGVGLANSICPWQSAAVAHTAGSDVCTIRCSGWACLPTCDPDCPGE